MKLWGKVGKTARGWHVRGLWQGKRIQLSQIPTGSGFIPCTSKDLADWLQIEVSKEIHANRFNPARYRKSKPLHVAKYGEKWLKLKEPNIDYETYRVYKSYFKNYIEPGLGKEYLPDLNYEKILEWLNDIDKSKAYKKKIHACLRGMLNDARRSGYISQLPEPVTLRKTKRVIEYATKEEQEAVIEALEPEQRHIFKFLFLTGLRPSEARGLQKSDIKEDHIIIRHTRGRKKGGERLKEVKTDKERRYPMFAKVRELLDSIPPSLHSYVFINPRTGKPYSKNINRDVWNPACLKALGYVVKLNKAGRHAFGNQLAAAGVDMESIGELYGHTDTKTTKDNYARPNLKVIGGMVDRIQGE